MEEVGKETVDTVRKTLEMAAGWRDEEILDGAREHHIKYTDLLYQESNGPREEWLRETSQTESRRARAGDCATRALNEATGGENYAEIWQEITLKTQTRYPEKDGDVGVNNHLYGEIYQEHGMENLLDRRSDMNHLMRNHLDIREIPELIGHLFEDSPLSYIACGPGHAVAVVDGAVHDSWDSREMGDRTRYKNPELLTELWIKTDDPAILEDAREIINRYEEVRRHDDPLTYGRRRRETIRQARVR